MCLVENVAAERQGSLKLRCVDTREHRRVNRDLVPATQRASGKEKERILDEPDPLTGYHRKSLIRSFPTGSMGKA